MKKITIYRYILLVWFNFFGQYIIANNYSKSQIGDTDINTLFTDREIYFVNDNIFFSFYLNSSKQTEYDENTIVYIELINLNQNIAVIQKMYQTDKGLINGKLEIPEKISTGLYLVKAYTNSTVKETEQFHSKYITIYNISDSHNLLVGKDNDVEFFPEGDALLLSKINKIIIKIPSKYKTESKFFVQKNESTVEHQLSENNIIHFEDFFEPLTEYKLVIKNAYDSVVIPFPSASEKGLITKIRYENQDIKYSVETNDKDNFKKYKLFILDENKTIIDNSELILNNFTFQQLFKNKIFNNGFNYFVLTDSDNNIIKINATYIKKNSSEKINIDINNSHIKSGDSVSVNLSANNIAEETELSIAVVQKNALRNFHNFEKSFYFQDKDILSDFFEKNSEMLSNEMENILIMYDKFIAETFKINLLKTGSNKSDFKLVHSGISLKGNLIDKSNGEGVKNTKVYLSVLSHNPQMHVTETDSAGEFSFNVNDVYDLVDIYLTCDASETIDYQINVRSPFKPTEQNNNRIEKYILKLDEANLKELYTNSQVENYFSNYTEEGKPFEHKKNPFNINDHIETEYVKDYVGIKNILELFVELIPSCKIRKENDKFIFQVYNNGNLLAGKPLVLVDNVPIFDNEKIINADISKLRKIEVINQVYILGKEQFNGVIMFSTSTNNFWGIEFSGNEIFVKYQAITSNYDTDYCGYKTKTKIPDYRTTLFWSPKLTLNKTGTFKFKTSERAGTYIIKAEGYTSAGKYISGTKEFIIE
jgi:hypothetical protein